jgi:hypothetical protein
MNGFSQPLSDGPMCPLLRRLVRQMETAARRKNVLLAVGGILLLFALAMVLGLAKHHHHKAVMGGGGSHDAKPVLKVDQVGKTNKKGGKGKLLRHL